jgi:hypothetical protein
LSAELTVVLCHLYLRKHLADYRTCCPLAPKLVLLLWFHPSPNDWTTTAHNYPDARLQGRIGRSHYSYRRIP